MATLSYKGKILREDLIPCPFCGGESMRPIGTSYLWFVCAGCSTEGPIGKQLSAESTGGFNYTDEDIQDAVKVWNTRAFVFSGSKSANIPTQAEAEAEVETDPQYSQEANAIFDKFLKNYERR